ncbi:hypothetical protein QQZ08_007924 [Neonectria magnoliae]|uniref:Subtilisin-like serine protease n=1 Tax=Neonectria magnoliae TaxID=2732573 RepID=A0ABR1HX35_9HYPO
MAVLFEPPFERPEAMAPPFVLPAAVALGSLLPRPKDDPRALRGGDLLLRPNEDLETYLKMDLIPEKLDTIHRHLHYAGAPRLARPLHRQRLMGREIIITEDVSEHLVWHQSKIFIKPLRAYLLDYDFWLRHLCSSELHKSACGFLLSYIWLVSWESDLTVAHDTHLFPKDLDWDTWTTFVASFMDRVDTKHLYQVAARYEYGELRLSRLDRIYRYTPTVFSMQNMFRGFLAPSTWYQDVFRRNFRWFLAVFAILSVALSAMQVALSTEPLNEDHSFQQASYGFAVFSLVAIAGFLVAIFLTWIVLALFFYSSAKWYHRRVHLERTKRTGGSV